MLSSALHILGLAICIFYWSDPARSGYGKALVAVSRLVGVLVRLTTAP